LSKDFNGLQEKVLCVRSLSGMLISSYFPEILPMNLSLEEVARLSQQAEELHTVHFCWQILELWSQFFLQKFSALKTVLKSSIIFFLKEEPTLFSSNQLEALHSTF
jgi:hypothetical protein